MKPCDEVISSGSIGKAHLPIGSPAEETYLLVLGLHHYPHCYPLPLEIFSKDLQSPQMTSSESLYLQNSMKVIIILWQNFAENQMLDVCLCSSNEAWRFWSEADHTGGVFRHTGPMEWPQPFAICSVSHLQQCKMQNWTEEFQSINNARLKNKLSKE